MVILGSEDQAETFRAHKASWEQCPAWKVRIRDVTPLDHDMKTYSAHMDPESGILADYMIAPPDVVTVQRLETHAEFLDYRRTRLGYTE